MDTDLHILRADNPGPLTGAGTNTYLLGRGSVIVIDPGPALPGHLQAILAALHPGDHVAAILVTHSHLDHSALARSLADATGAPVLGCGPAGSGRSPTMKRLACAGLTGGGEGCDRTYRPDRPLMDGEKLTIGGVTVEVIAIPGHTGCHLAFATQGRLFAGDTVMGWSTSLVSPPDGDMGAYMATLGKLAGRDWAVIHPGHGAMVTDAAGRLSDLIAHRQTREAAILAALSNRPATAADLARLIYTTTPAALLPAATRNVLAHLINLSDRTLVTHPDPIRPDSTFSAR